VVSPFSGDPRILFIGVWLLLARLSTNKNDWRLDLSTTTRQTDIITGLCLLTAARFLHYSVHTAHFRHSINNLRNNALTLLVGRQEGNPACKKTELWGAGVVICLEWGADLHMASWCHCNSLSLASVKSRLVLPFWYQLTRVVPDKGLLNGSVCVYSQKQSGC